MDLDPAQLSELLSFDPEKDDGNCEYKYKLTNLSDDQMNHLAVQLKYRLDEGFGEAIYEIGLRDDGFPVGLTQEAMDESLNNLKKLAESISAKISYVNRRSIGNIKLPTTEEIEKTVENVKARRKAIAFQLDHADDKKKSKTKKYKSSKDHCATNESTEEEITSDSEGPLSREVAEVLIREDNTVGGYIDIRMAVAGNVDSSKCLGIDTPVMMSNGTIKKVQDVKVGDHVMGDDSKPREVLHTTTGKGRLYEVLGSNSNSYIVNDAHVLSLMINTVNNEALKTILDELNELNETYDTLSYTIDINIQDYLKLSDIVKSYLSGYRIAPYSSEHVILSKIKVKSIGLGDYYGFTVDGNGRFLLGDLTVTHNSSTVGVLIKGTLDNGRGSARLNVFNHKHEILTGRTSSIGQQIMGFDSEGNLVNAKYKIKNPSWKEIVSQSSKIITFFDLAGHEKYLKTTITGFSQHDPDYCMLMVGANMGITHITREHMILCLSLKVPFFIVMSKMDIAPENIIKETYDKIVRLLKLPGVRKIPYKVKTIDDAILCSKNMISENVVPIFQISNVTGMNVDHLRVFLNCLPPKRRDAPDLAIEKVRYNINEIFSVPGVGTVVSGLLTHGTVKVGDKLLLGPDKNNSFTETHIKSIECKRVPLNQVTAGFSVCFALKKISRNEVKRGMVLLDPALKPVPIWDFEAEITILHSHSTSINCGYSPMLHINNVRQVAEIIKIYGVTTQKERKKVPEHNQKDENHQNHTTTIKAPEIIQLENQKEEQSFKISVLKTGDRAKVHFKFMFHPEWFEEGSRLVFREGKTKGVGIITKIFDHQEKRTNLGRKKHRHRHRQKKINENLNNHD